MKKTIYMTLAAALLIAGLFYAKKKFYDPAHKVEKANSEITALAQENKIKDGDLIFQTSLSAQSQAIQLATHSTYSHCGIIYKNGDAFYVFEAVQPVKLTPLDAWIARGQDGKFVIKRLQNAQQILTPQTLQLMRQVGEKFAGKDYDLAFEWSDDKIYCSELIWKIYKRATGLDIGRPEKLGDFDLSNSAVQKKMKERYGDSIPMNETVISPAAIFNCELLITTAAN